MQSAKPDSTLRVMSFNIRNSAANDGANSWIHRRADFMEVIRKYGPDLLGTQEVLQDQAEALRADLPEYGFVGVGRDDGKTRGEYSPLMYRKSRFEEVGCGTFWLSESPEGAGSKSWDSSLPRVATWARLRDKFTGGHEILVANTHFDHRGTIARLKSAELLRLRLTDLAGEAPVILMGDFNTVEADSPIQELLKGGAFIDSYREIHRTHSPEEATFHAFKGEARGERIDFIFHSKAFVTAGADIDRSRIENRLPSDHFAITANLTFR